MPDMNKLPKMIIDPERRGMIRFEGEDEFSGLLAGMRAAEIAQACNSYHKMLGALKKAEQFLAGFEGDQTQEDMTALHEVRAAIESAEEDAA